jgi:hypothetical protein
MTRFREVNNNVLVVLYQWTLGLISEVIVSVRRPAVWMVGQYAGHSRIDPMLA